LQAAAHPAYTHLRALSRHQSGISQHFQQRPQLLWHCLDACFSEQVVQQRKVAQHAITVIQRHRHTIKQPLKGIACCILCIQER
jgi:hypothetical protein